MKQQIKHSQQQFFQREQGFTRLLDAADKNFFRNNVHIYKFYFVTSVVTILTSIILIHFITDHVILKALVIELPQGKIPQVKGTFSNRT